MKDMTYNTRDELEFIDGLGEWSYSSAKPIPLLHGYLLSAERRHNWMGTEFPVDRVRAVAHARARLVMLESMV